MSSGIDLRVIKKGIDEGGGFYLKNDQQLKKIEKKR
jgi:hypothetical protein